jgi:hypothetical protein
MVWVTRCAVLLLRPIEVASTRRLGRRTRCAAGWIEPLVHQHGEGAGAVDLAVERREAVGGHEVYDRFEGALPVDRHQVRRQARQLAQRREIAGDGGNRAAKISGDLGPGPMIWPARPRRP